MNINLRAKDAGSVAKSIGRLISIQKLLCGFEFLVFQSNVFKLGLLFKLEMTSGIEAADNLLWPLPEKIFGFRYRSRSKRGRNWGQNKILKLNIVTRKLKSLPNGPSP